MSTTKSVWFTSKGLDISPYDEEPTQEYIKVHFGELEGTFKSLHSKNKRLTFEISDIELALNYLENPPKEACIVYSQFLYKIEWKDHNYSLEKAGQYKLLVTVEESNES